MDDFRRCHVPAFGSWNGSDEFQFSECFEAAKQMDLFPYKFYGGDRRDLYVAGDLYGYDMVTPAVIVLPRRRTKSRYPKASEAKKGEWGNDMKEPPSPVLSLSPPLKKKAYKPLDEDLYKISPDLLYAKPKRNRGWGIFSNCCMPTCAA